MPAPNQAAPAEISEEQRAAQAHARAVEERTRLFEAQNANARANKLEKLARKDPHIRDVLEEMSLMAASLRANASERQRSENTIADLRAQIDSQAAEIAALKATVADRDATIGELRAQLPKKK